MSMEGQSIPNISRRLSRRDVAKFMLNCIDKDDTVHKQIAIGTGN